MNLTSRHLLNGICHFMILFFLFSKHLTNNNNNSHKPFEKTHIMDLFLKKKTRVQILPPQLLDKN